MKTRRGEGEQIDSKISNRSGLTSFGGAEQSFENEVLEKVYITILCPKGTKCFALIAEG